MGEWERRKFDADESLIRHLAPYREKQRVTIARERAEAANTRLARAKAAVIIAQAKAAQADRTLNEVTR
jgi:hypothetical protein